MPLLGELTVDDYTLSMIRFLFLFYLHTQIVSSHAFRTLMLATEKVHFSMKAFLRKNPAPCSKQSLPVVMTSLDSF